MILYIFERPEVTFNISVCVEFGKECLETASENDSLYIIYTIPMQYMWKYYDILQILSRN